MTSTSDAVAQLFGAAVTGSVALSGGNLSTVHRLTLADGRSVIAKAAVAAKIEANMLRAIAAAGAPAPGVVAANDDLLVIAQLPSDGSVSDAWPDLAAALAKLHSATADHFGWPVDHAFGPVAIPNAWCDDWSDFWAERRLRCHLPHVAPELARRIERLADGLDDRLPMQPKPSLLHGDLWGGNVLVSAGRVSGLIDPACYHGHGEVDVAMLTLFDHPPQTFFEAMELEAGWRERQPVYRLWPLLVHLRLFGGGYHSAVSTCLSSLGV